MSTATAIVESPAAHVAAGTRPSLARLIIVELRKMVDTRAGFWLQLATLASMIALVVVAVVVGEPQDSRFQDMFLGALWPASVLLPIVGILLVTSEWSQRTALITFTLVPRRSRVVVAKLGAGVAMAFAALVTSLAMGAVATVIAAPGVANTWSLAPEILGQAALYAAAVMIVGLAFGMALLSPAPAIVLYFVLPIGWTLLSSISALDGVGRWLDSSRSLEPLTEGSLDATEWARVGTTLALWMLLPLLVGLWRITRREVQ
jgi:ABC-2 type transport system permease protein